MVPMWHLLTCEVSLHTQFLEFMGTKLHFRIFLRETALMHLQYKVFSAGVCNLGHTNQFQIKKTP